LSGSLYLLQKTYPIGSLPVPPGTMFLYALHHLWFFKQIRT
jgi:hypothetical protein